MSRMKLAILLGGVGGEHSVSIASGTSVARAASPDRYEITLIGIARDGRWLLLEGESDLASPSDPAAAGILPGVGRQLAPVPGGRAIVVVDGAARGRPEPIVPDVVFPVLHGPMGEDGTVQGVLEAAGIPYVGAGVAGSAAGMDKDVMKRLARDAGIDMTPFLVVGWRHWSTGRDATCENVKSWSEKQGFPVYVKPAGMGSSVGISRVDGPEGVAAALDGAFFHDTKIVVEKGVVDPREIECAVLGGLDPDAAPALGEVLTRAGSFYTWDAKYADPGAASTVVPADLDPKVAARVRSLAVRAFRVLECWGMARVDFLVERGSGRVLFNEINTIPGFTDISMFAKMWGASGLSYPKLIDRLVDLAMERPVPASRRAARQGTGPST